MEKQLQKLDFQQIQCLPGFSIRYSEAWLQREQQL